MVPISHNYFPRVVKACEEELASTQQQQKEKEVTRSRSSAANNTEEEEGERPHQTRNKLIASAIAVTVMAGYAYISGLMDAVRNIEIRIGEEGDDREYAEEGWGED